MSAEPIPFAQGKAGIVLLPQMSNRHGLIAGATGTGKTVTLQVLAESFSARGVPVFLADVKGDLAGLSQPGGQSPKVQERLRQLKLDGYAPAGCPVVFWDVFGDKGHPVRTTISEMGPLLLSRLLLLNETQAGVLNIVFRVADANGLLLLDLTDGAIRRPPRPARGAEPPAPDRGVRCPRSSRSPCAARAGSSI